MQDDTSTYRGVQPGLPWLSTDLSTLALRSEGTALLTRRHPGDLILVVDDEAAIRQLTQHALEAFGYRVVVAADGTEAVARHAERRDEIALVLSDMMMSGMDGLAAIRLLREMTPGLGAILASGLIGDGTRAPAAAEGIHHFLAKPFTVEVLVRTVREALDAWRRENLRSENRSCGTRNNSACRAHPP